MNLETIGKLLIGAALFLLLFGLIFLVLGRAGLSRLPGDIFFRRGRTAIYFPIVTSILASIILTVLLNLLFYFWRR